MLLCLPALGVKQCAQGWLGACVSGWLSPGRARLEGQWPGPRMVPGWSQAARAAPVILKMGASWLQGLGE